LQYSNQAGEVGVDASNIHVNGWLSRACCASVLSLLLVSFGGACSGDDADEGGTGCDGGVCPDGSIGEGGRSGSTGSAGRSGSGGSSTAGRSGSGGTMSEPDEDGGVDTSDAGMMSEPGEEPATDGSQLASCAEDGDCTEDRVCYTPGAQGATGYCTGTCAEDEDCAAIGPEYTCNDRGGGGQGPGNGPDGMCRLECEGTDDTSCPAPMTCVETSPDNFRCAFVPEDEPGAQNVPLWEPCTESSECVAGLICYGTVAGGGGGDPVGGFCTQPCENDDECTEDEPSGEIEPTCGTTGGCRFDCSDDEECPDGMECVSQGGGPGGNVSRCLYPTQ
jgi:hypothetical protein